MAEYIEREVAYELARTNDYYSDFHKSMADLTSLKELLDDTPAADVVEVVRCGQCQHSTDDIVVEGVCYCHKIQQGMFIDDFCSYGERRKEK